MIDKDPRLQALRDRAETALDRGEVTLQGLDVTIRQDITSLIQELTVYQAELELQNRELRETQAMAERLLERYTTLFQHLPLPGIVIDHHGLIQEANEPAVNLFGFRSSGSLRHHSVYRLLADRQNAALAEALVQRNSAGPFRVTTLEMRSAQGDSVPMDVHLIEMPMSFHLERHFALLFVDRSADLQREQEHRLFQTLLDNTNAMVFAFDREGICLLANRVLLRVIERELDQVVGQRRTNWLTDDDAYQQDYNDTLVIATGRALTYEEKLHRPGREVRYFLSHKFPLRDRNGGIFGVGGITTEVTESRRNEARLELAMQVFSKGTEGILITDADNRILSVNRAFTRITGYAESEVIGQNPSLLASGRHDRRFYEQLWATLLRNGAWEGEIWNRRRTGEIYPQWLNISRVPGGDAATTNYIGVFSDITHRKLAEEEIEQLAYYDALTGTPNRHLLQDRVSQAIRVAHREGHKFALIFFDLDHFKEVNDVFGHEMGDRVLREVAQRVRECIREEDTLSRLGGDEFVLLLPEASHSNVRSRLQALLDAISRPYSLDEHTLQLSASMGIAIYPDDGDSYQALLKNADIAMYQSKAEGRNTLHFFNPAMAARARQRLEIETALQAALAGNELHLVYQPQVELASGRITGVETLLRWNSATLGEQSPEDFIPIAEDSGLIVPLGQWVLTQALAQLARWQAAGRDGFRLAINISSRQFWCSDFVDQLAHLLADHKELAQRLELEITERTAMDNPRKAIPVMQSLKQLGVRLALDDFGTGYSSLSSLRRMPLDTLKIDGSFVQKIGVDADGEVICRSIISLATTLGLEVIAEGVETEPQTRFLLSHDCRTGQGFRFGAALEAEALNDRLAAPLTPPPPVEKRTP